MTLLSLTLSHTASFSSALGEFLLHLLASAVIGEYDRVSHYELDDRF